LSGSNAHDFSLSGEAGEDRDQREGLSAESRFLLREADGKEKSWLSANERKQPGSVILVF
jgi:hypothetical protein